MPPTEYELELLQQASDIDNAWLEIGQRLTREYGVAIGVGALLIVLDTLGTEKTHVPSREMFFQRLYRPIRDAEILQLLDSDNTPITSIAAAMEVSEGRVRQIHRAAKRSGRRYRAKRVCRRA